MWFGSIESDYILKPDRYDKRRLFTCAIPHERILCILIVTINKIKNEAEAKFIHSVPDIIYWAS